MIARISKKEINDNIYIVSWGIYLFVTLWNQSFFPLMFTGRYYTFLLVFCLLLLCFKEFIYIDFNLKSSVTAIGMTTLGILVYIFSSHWMLLAFMFFIFSARNINIGKVINISLIISVFILCVVTFCALNGVIYNEIYIDYIEGRERQYLGFAYMLFPVSIWSNITCLWIAKRKDVYTWMEIILLFIINQLLFEYTNSRLVYLIVLMRIFALIIIKSKIKGILINAMMKKILAYSMPVACMFAFYVTINYNPTDMYQYLINFILEGRLELGQYAIFTYGWPMFGEAIKWVGNGLDENGVKTEGVYNYVDCAYIHFELEYGVIALLLLIWTIVKFISNMAKKNEIIIMILFATISIQWIIDDLSIMMHYNTLLLLLGTLIPSKFKQVM